MPEFYIIAGCNGAGKTTASYTVLPEILNCKEFVNADEIARGLSPFQPKKVAIQAARIMLHRINELMNLKENFAIETTLTSLSYQQTINKAKMAGYSVTLIFFWLNNVNLAIERVEVRAKEGGHNIPVATIRRRYTNGIKNLTRIFLPIYSKCLILDNSDKPYSFVAEKNQNGEVIIYDTSIWNAIKK